MGSGSVGLRQFCNSQPGANSAELRFGKSQSAANLARIRKTEGQEPAERTTRGRQAAAGAVTIADVIAMSQAGVENALIINEIRLHGLAASLKASDIISLHRQGVSREVIAVMQAERVAVPEGQVVSGYELPPIVSPKKLDHPETTGHSDAPACPPEPVSSSSPSDRFCHIQDRLRQLGATYYLLETCGDEKGEFRFYCKISVGGNPRVTKGFWCYDNDPMKAMTAVLKQVEDWSSLLAKRLRRHIVRIRRPPRSTAQRGISTATARIQPRKPPDSRLPAAACRGLARQQVPTVQPGRRRRRFTRPRIFVYCRMNGSDSGCSTSRTIRRPIVPTAGYCNPEPIWSAVIYYRFGFAAERLSCELTSRTSRGWYTSSCIVSASSSIHPTAVTEPSKDDFAQLMIDRIHQAGEKGPIAYQREEFRLRGEGERSAALMLGNAYKEYCAADEEKRERVLRHWVRNWFNLLRDMPEDFEDVKPDLLPIVRSRSHFELNQLRSLVETGTPISWPYVPLGEHFGVALVYDLPDAMRSIPQANLDAWGLTLYEALEIACENLATLPAKFIGPQSGEGVYLSATGDNYDASRILSPELIGQFQVKGDPVAMIANRDNLIVAGADDADGLEAMLKMAAEALQQLRPISSIAVRFDGEEWVPWLPEASHPLHKQFRRLYFDAWGATMPSRKSCSTACTPRRTRRSSWPRSTSCRTRRAGS